MAIEFDGLLLDDGVSYKTYRVSRAHTPAARGHLFQGRVSRSGAALLRRPPAARVIRLEGCIRGTSLGVTESRRDTLLKTLARARRRLVYSSDASRYVLATASRLDAHLSSATYGTWAAEFTSEDAYESAVLPSGDVRTSTLTLLPGETTAYGTQFALTPGGSAPSPVRWVLVNQAHGVTPTLIELRNLTTGEALAVTSPVGSGGGLVIDPHRGVEAFDALNIVGWWPLADADGPVLDFSSNGRNFTENGTVTFRQDGPLGHDVAASGWSASNYLSSSSAAFGITGTISFALWLNHAVTPPGLASAISKASSLAGWSLLLNSASYNFQVRTSAGTLSASSTTAPAPGRWEFVVGTFSATGARQRLWFGTEDQPPRLHAQNAVSGSLTVGTNDLRLGAGHRISDGTVIPLEGAVRLASPAIYNLELTEDQVQRIWQRGPQAYRDGGVDWSGSLFELNPREGATNLVQVRADSTVSAPTLRSVATWRSRHE